MRTTSAAPKQSRIENTTRGTWSEHFSRNFHISNLALTEKGITNTIYSFVKTTFFRQKLHAKCEKVHASSF